MLTITVKVITTPSTPPNRYILLADLISLKSPFPKKNNIINVKTSTDHWTIVLVYQVPILSLSLVFKTPWTLMATPDIIAIIKPNNFYHLLYSIPK